MQQISMKPWNLHMRPDLKCWTFICTETTLTTNLTQIFSCFCDFAGEWTSVWCMQDKSLRQSIRWTEMHTAKAQKQLVPNLWVGDVRCGRIMKNRITSLITWFWTKRWTPTLLGITSDLKVTGYQSDGAYTALHRTHSTRIWDLDVILHMFVFGWWFQNIYILNL